LPLPWHTSHRGAEAGSAGGKESGALTSARLANTTINGPANLAILKKDNIERSKSL
jgi:hypothetical protein